MAQRAPAQTFMVGHYWLVDVEEKTIEVHVLRGSEYTLAHTVRGDEAHRLPPFETYALPLRDLWAR